MSPQIDIVVVGQGLAGSALGWMLRFSGLRFLVIDREDDVTASRVAAGLITPITGQKLIPTWRRDELWPAAVEFYQRVERETGTAFFRQTPMVRLFEHKDEVDRFRGRMHDPAFASLTGQPFSTRERPTHSERDPIANPADSRSGQPTPLLDDRAFRCERGGFQMAPGGQLNVSAYLQASRHAFEETDCYRSCDLDVSREVKLTGDGVSIARLNLQASAIVFCQGVAATDNPWFRDVRFKPAKGEILTLQISGLSEQRVVHRGVWLAPVGDGFFKAGATYDWTRLDCEPTTAGRDEIIERVRAFVRLPFEVVGHDAAVRPIHRNQYPILGRHPVHSQLVCFNGLGSKGSLHSPYFARQLVWHLVEGQPLDADVDVIRKTTWSEATWAASSSGGVTSPASRTAADRRQEAARRPLTQQAQEAVQAALQSGDTAIDATAGNGHDTQFLAQAVGSTGNVFAFDVQPIALANTRRRLADAQITNVVLLQRDHSEMSAAIPTDLYGRIGAVMFNLGYLPGGDKQLVTHSDSTRHAIRVARDLLRPGGVMSVLAYTGHDGGQAEADMAESVIDSFPSTEFQITKIESTPGRTSGPRLFLVKRIGRSSA